MLIMKQVLNDNSGNIDKHGTLIVEKPSMIIVFLLGRAESQGQIKS